MSTSAHGGEGEQFKAVQEKEAQNLPGWVWEGVEVRWYVLMVLMFRSEREMKPTSESTALEGAQGFVEYVAAGKLKGKKALITGGE
jgi:hypothetical protein